MSKVPDAHESAWRSSGHERMILASASRSSVISFGVPRASFDAG